MFLEVPWAILEAGPQAIVIRDQDGAVLAANAAAEQLLGLSRAQLRGRAPVDPRWRTVREDGSPFPLQPAPFGPAPESGEPDGSVILGVVDPERDSTTWIEVRALPRSRPGAAGPHPAVEFLADITARKRLEQQLLASQAMEERAEKLARFGTWQLALATRRFRGSLGTKRTFGMLQTEWPAGQILKVALPEYRGMLVAAMRALIQQGKPCSVQFRIRRPADGHLRFIHALAEYEPSQQLVCGVILDVTDRHRLETALEQRVQERTAQLEDANRELEAFSYSVSHDLRAPLRTVDQFSQILMEDNQAQLDEDSRHALSRIRKAAQRMGQLIEDLLELASVNRRKLSLEPVDVSTLARDILAGLAQAWTGPRFQVSVEDGMRVRADGGLLLVVLENLLGNAWKYTGRTTEPRIEVGTMTEPAGRRTFFIRDNGAGFDMACTGNLFTAFQRLHSTKDFEGTGIGLAIVQRIIRRHGGRIWAEAKPNQGAAFFFTLPDAAP